MLLLFQDSTQAVWSVLLPVQETTQAVWSVLHTWGGLEYYGMPTTTPTTNITAYPLLPSCPSGCTCMGAKNAYNQGRVPCPSGSAGFVCGVNQPGEEMHCYSDTLPTTTTATQTVTTLATTPITQIPPIPPASDTTPATAPAASGQQVSATVALSSCRGECRCILPDTATVLGLPLCGGDPSLCSYDASGKAMYCYALAQQAATTESGIPVQTHLHVRHARGTAAVLTR